ncbi:MAG: class I SAM-dependent methyltransferase [Bacteriovoracaceae bacterium]|nr:class I SAM-dependent methyltransferase [Bacteriovoracaceae bacterium]
MFKVNLVLNLNDSVPSHLIHENIIWTHEKMSQNSLYWNGKQLSFRPLNEKALPIFFDFPSKLSYHASRQYNLKKEIFAKAIGINQYNSIKILDGSLGTGKDAMLLLSFGARVRGIERNPIVYLLLKDAYHLALKGREKHFLKENFSLELSASHNVKLSQDDDQSVFYFDPMFKKMRNKSKSKKEMEIFKYLVGIDDDYQDVLTWAMEQKFSRVVLKRSIHDDKYLKPTASYTGNTVRYDMYSL